MIYKKQIVPVSANEIEELEKELKKDKKKKPDSQKSEPKTETKPVALVSHSDFYNKYILPSEVSDKLDKAVYALEGNPIMQSEFLIANKAEKHNLENTLIGFIHTFGTKDVDAEGLNLTAKALRMHSKISRVYSKGNNLVIEFKDGTSINSMVLSRTMGWETEELESLKRVNKGQQMSVEVAKALPFESTIVTGNIAGLTNKSTYLHSWVETTLDGKPVVIDYSMNSIMNKDGYYRLRHAQPISLISSKDFKDDLLKIKPYIETGCFTCKEYLTLRDEIMAKLSQENSSN